jgi:DNA-binding GntR family transcriptional regulator
MSDIRVWPCRTREREDAAGVADAGLRVLREHLIDGRIGPGDAIRPDRVATASGVGVLRISRALRVLLAEGRVEYDPECGYRATTATLAESREILLMCGLLEREALRRGVPELDDAGIERMRSLLDTLLRPPPSASVWDVATVHEELHFVPISYAQLPRVEGQLRRLWDHTDHRRALYLFGAPHVGRRMNDEHAAIVEACCARDAERVVELMEAHRAHALAHLAEHSGLPTDDAS